MGTALNKAFWSSDWFVALAICSAFAVAYWAGSSSLETLERAAYDLGVESSSREPSSQIAVIAIDDQSIANLGRWPWPRDMHARMIDILREAGVKVIGNTIFYSEPQADPGLVFVEEIAQTYREAGVIIDGMERLLADAMQALDTDAILATSTGGAGNVVLGMLFERGEPRGRPDEALPPFVKSNRIANVVDRVDAEFNGRLPLPARAPLIVPIERIGSQAHRIGHMNSVRDVDGAYRVEPLAVRYFDEYYPSISLQLAAAGLNLGPGDINIMLGEGVQLGQLKIATNPYLEMSTFFYADVDGKPAFAEDSFFDVFTGNIDPAKYRDKIVLIGASATGIGNLYRTPISPAMPPVMAAAHTVSSILQEDFFISPQWGGWVTFALFLLVCGYLIAVLPRLRAASAFLVTVLLIAAFCTAHLILMTNQAIWVEMMTPAALALVGYILLTSKRFLVTERGKERSEAESAETNRMLGLAYQGKGDLDAAFASFRKVPFDDSVMDLLYNLALDFERKRQFHKASSVYRHMTEFNPKFRDIDDRLHRSQSLEDTILFGSAKGAHSGGRLLVGGSGVEKPMLGRYELEKELGKGAMGVVYLGRDPKINRTVAIKTMALAEEFDDDEIDEVKERFFREAETAGRLNHPNIVTIFDAGEDHELAYISMEFLKGQDLSLHTRTDDLLPLREVLKIVRVSADALDYAHQQNVVHRDVKPANIMYEPRSGMVKLTDFGIARITDSSKTKTGMVLGTPSYMSPEQLSGKRVDGRSDLFSLGVTLFQLTTGELPFVSDSMATLMFKIANDHHPDILELNPQLPAELAAIIDKALAKSADERYARGAQMIKDVDACLASLDAAA